MADATSSIFNKKATEKLRSPDDLDKYVRTANPSAWVVLGACIALLLGLLAWGVFGAVSTSVSTTAVRTDTELISFVDADTISKISVGDEVYISGSKATVSNVSNVPISRTEAVSILGNDYLASTIFEDEWAYPVKYDCPELEGLPEYAPLSATITIDRVAPISLIFGN